MSASLLLSWRPRADAVPPESFDAVAAAFPARVRGMESADRTAAGARVRCWWHGSSRTDGFHDDPATGSWIAVLGGPARADLAELTGEGVLRVLLDDCLARGPSVLDSVSPPFALVFHDGRDGATHVGTDRCGIQTLYMCERDDGEVWIASSALALAGALPSTVDPEGLAEWLAIGHFISQRTLFNEITKLPCGARLTLGSSRSASWTPGGSHTASPDDFVGQLVASVRASRGGGKVATELTGGLDSRALLAVLLSESPPFFAWTVGRSDSAELRTVDRLRRRRGFEHVLAELDEGIAREMPALVREMHELSDGEVNAVEYAPLLSAFRDLDGRRDVSMSGTGGECARGFYYGALRGAGADPRGVAVDPLLRKLTGATGAVAALLRPELMPDPYGPARRALESFIEASPQSTPVGIMEDLYVRGRMQRFAGRNVTTTGLFCVQGLPYLSNALVDLAFALPPEWKRDGRVMRSAIERLAPDLARIPLDSGMSVRAASWSRPDRHALRGLALGRKALDRYGGAVGKRIAARPPDNVPWDAVRRDPGMGEFVRELLLADGARVTELLDPPGVRALAESSLSGRGSMYQLGLLVTLELTLRGQRN